MGNDRIINSLNKDFEEERNEHFIFTTYIVLLVLVNNIVTPTLHRLPFMRWHF